jgi:STE24 endopeptidase
MAYFNPAELQAMAQAGVTPPPITPEMLSYCRLRYALIFASIGWNVLMLLGLLHFGVAAAITRVSERVTKHKWLQVPLYCVLLLGLAALIRLPFAWYASYHVDHSYGLSDQPLGGWFADFAKGRMVNLFENALGFTVAFAIIERFRKRWPIVLWGALLPLIAAGIFLAPLLIDPLFNKFQIMPPSASEARIRAVAVKSGIPNAPIYIVDKSKQTKKLNAYVTGLGTSTRIVIWDNTLEKLPIDQVEAIVGHEAGHYVLGHIVIGFSVISAALLAGLLLGGRYAESLVARLPSRWGVRSLTDTTCIPVLLLLAVVGNFLFAPIENGISRAMERQADEFGLRVTQNGPAMARTFVSLASQNLAEPEPPAFIQFWLFGHPSLRERILNALGLR